MFLRRLRYCDVLKEKRGLVFYYVEIGSIVEKKGLWRYLNLIFKMLVIVGKGLFLRLFFYM